MEQHARRGVRAPGRDAPIGSCTSSVSRSKAMRRVSGRSTREEVTKALTKFAGAAGPNDLVFIALIGHGQWDGRSAKFNMPGPDMGPEDFDAAAEEASDASRSCLSTPRARVARSSRRSRAPGRTLVSATRSGAEHYTTLFGGFFVDALNSPNADADKNKRISVLEAFQFAKAEVARAYEREGLLATEHPMLDDDGDKKGSADPIADRRRREGGRGALARRCQRRRAAVGSQAARAAPGTARDGAARRVASIAEGQHGSGALHLRAGEAGHGTSR